MGIMGLGNEGDNGLWVAWSLTVAGVSNPRPLTEPSCLGIDPEMGSEIGRSGDSVYAFAADAVVGVRSASTTETMFKLSGEILESTRLFQRNVEKKIY